MLYSSEETGRSDGDARVDPASHAIDTVSFDDAMSRNQGFIDVGWDSTGSLVAAPQHRNSVCQVYGASNSSRSSRAYSAFISPRPQKAPVRTAKDPSGCQVLLNKPSLHSLIETAQAAGEYTLTRDRCLMGFMI